MGRNDLIKNLVARKLTSGEIVKAGCVPCFARADTSGRGPNAPLCHAARRTATK